MTLKYFNVKNGLSTGNIILHAGNSNVEANTFVGNISVTSLANLGDVGNIRIAGGSDGYVLQTDGTGNLSWTAQTGGGGQVQLPDVSLDSFTGDGSNISFTLTKTPQSKDYLIVNVDGVLQLSDAYTLSGNVLTFGSTPLVDSPIEIRTLIPGSASSSSASANTIFNGNSNVKVYSNSVVTISSNGVSNIVSVSSTDVDIVANVNVTGKTSLGSVSNVAITGGTAGQALITDGAGNLSFGTVASGSQLGADVDTYVGDGTTFTYSLSVTPASKNYTVLMVDGVMQPKSAYTISGTTLALSSPAPNGAVIEITTFGGNATVPTQVIPDILSPFMFIGI